MLTWVVLGDLMAAPYTNIWIILCELVFERCINGNPESWSLECSLCVHHQSGLKCHTFDKHALGQLFAMQCMEIGARLMP